MKLAKVVFWSSLIVRALRVKAKVVGMTSNFILKTNNDAMSVSSAEVVLLQISIWGGEWTLN